MENGTSLQEGRRRRRGLHCAVCTVAILLLLLLMLRPSITGIIATAGVVCLLCLRWERNQIRLSEMHQRLLGQAHVHQFDYVVRILDQLINGVLQGHDLLPVLYAQLFVQGVVQ